jgi:hypothetical protein
LKIAGSLRRIGETSNGTSAAEAVPIFRLTFGQICPRMVFVKGAEIRAASTEVGSAQEARVPVCGR